MNGPLLKLLLLAKAQRGVLPDQLVLSFFEVRREALLTGAGTLSMPVILARPASAAGYRVRACQLLKRPTRSLSAHRKLKTSAGLFSSRSFSTQTVRCPRRSAIFTSAASRHWALAQCVPGALWPVLRQSSLLTYTPLSLSTSGAVPKTSSRFISTTMSQEKRSLFAFSTSGTKDASWSGSTSCGPTEFRIRSAPFRRSMGMTCWTLYERADSSAVLG